MKKQKKKLDIPYKFWKGYEEADFIKRSELLKPIIKRFMSLKEIKDKKMVEHMLEISLQGYFDDIIEYFCTKESKSNQSKPRRYKRSNK